MGIICVSSKLTRRFKSIPFLNRTLASSFVMRHVIEITSYPKVAKLGLSKTKLECVKHIKPSTSQSLMKVYDLLWTHHGCFHHQKRHNQTDVHNQSNRIKPEQFEYCTSSEY